MASELKVLGQSAPAAATLVDLYTVPASTESVCSSLTVCNISAVETTFRMAVRPLGASISDEHYIYYDLPLAGHDTFVATVGLSLGATDVVSVYNTLSTLSFSLFGREIS